MRRKWVVALLGSLIATGLAGTIFVLGAPGSPAAQQVNTTSVNAGLQRREASSDVESPDISFINSPSATCHRPVAGTAACYIEWSYLSVSAGSGAYVISMTVTIDNQLRAYHAGFFQSSMYIPGEMTAPGYRVSCGAPGSGVIASMGESYSYTIRARDTSGLTAANYGSVTCPADIVKVYLPSMQRH
jgi:hypothetical protein